MTQSLPYIPPEIQKHIISYLKLPDWCSVKDICFLQHGLELFSLWKKVDLDQADDITDELFDLLTKHGHKIRTLEWISAQWNCTRQPLQLLNTFSCVTSVTIIDNQNLTSLNWLTNNEVLTHLCLAKCNSFPANHLDLVLPTIINLKTLDLSECYAASLPRLLSILPHFHRLEYCNVRDCCSFDYQTVTDLCSGFASLKRFLFCPQINFDEILCWVNVLEDESTALELCPAMVEIIEDLIPE